MLDALVRPVISPFAFARTGSRAARVGTFALETWSRLLVDRGKASAEDRARELSWVAENTCAIHGVRTLSRGAPPQGPCVLVANHISYFDPLIVASYLPLTAIAKREVASWPIVGEFVKRLGTLFVDRDNACSGARVLREAISLLNRGVSVLVFPEGTTTRGDQVLPFKRGIFGAALRAGVPIVPIALSYEREDAAWVGNTIFLSHYMRTMSHPCTRVSVEFLRPLAMSLPSGRARTPEQLAEAARRAIARAATRSDGRARAFPAHLPDAEFSVATA
jgi:1-acyl-sn-glycerol-3-phosphate acyltransferase